MHEEYLKEAAPEVDEETLESNTELVEGEVESIEATLTA